MSKANRWIVLCMLATGLSVLAVPVTPTMAQHEVPFMGVVLEDRTAVRAGAGQPFYVVGELSRDDQVMVREVIVGWMRVDAPTGTFSYISRLHADVSADERHAVVNTDRAPVMAASPQGPAPSYQIQRHLDQGTRLEVVATEGNFLKVLPPAGATVFLAPGSIRRATADDLVVEAEPQQPQAPSDAQDAPLASIEPAVDVDVVEEVVESEATETVTERVTEVDDAREVVRALEVVQTTEVELEEVQVDAQTTVVHEQITLTTDVMQKESDVPVVQEGSPAATLDARMRPLFLQPVETQPFDEMEAAYRELLDDEQLSSGDRRLVNLRLAAIERNRQLADVLASLTAAQQQVETASDDAEAARLVREQQVARAREQQQRREFNLHGQLLASSVFDGENTPLMLRLVDANNGRTLGYLQPTDSAKASHLLGENVAIAGGVSFDPSLGLNIIQVSQIEKANR